MPRLHPRQLFAIAILLPFIGLTFHALQTIGLIGLFQHQFENPAGWQVLADLVIALLIAMLWLLPEAKQAGRKPMVWFALTCMLGSIAPLLYLAITPPPAQV